ncbi:MAG: hypothetical protein KC434_09545 [Anaerolineales bacterium]|nr:hypothetical protein [Anaerolineales bacterium]
MVDELGEKTAVLPHPHPMLPVTIIVPQINPKRDPLPMGRYIGNGSWTLAMGRGHWQWVVDIGNVVYNQTTLQPTPFCLSVM